MCRVLLLALCLAALPALAQEPRKADRPGREYIYGGELMSGQERERYRRAWSAAKGDEGRAGVQKRHRERMQQRARERGVTLDEQGVVKKKP